MKNMVDKKQVPKKDPKELLRRILGILTIFIVLYFGVLEIIREQGDVMSYIRTSSFMGLCVFLVVIFITYSFLTGKYEFVTPKQKGQPKRNAPPKEIRVLPCAICGKPRPDYAIKEFTIDGEKVMVCDICLEKEKNAV